MAAVPVEALAVLVGARFRRPPDPRVVVCPDQGVRREPLRTPVVPREAKARRVPRTLGAPMGAAARTILPTSAVPTEATVESVHGGATHEIAGTTTATSDTHVRIHPPPSRPRTIIL